MHPGPVVEGGHTHAQLGLDAHDDGIPAQEYLVEPASGMPGM